jgi:hypothetical protein
LQDARKGQTSHPPNPGAPRRALSQARPQRVKTPEAYPLGYVEDLNDARTTLAAFFSLLLLHEQQACIANFLPSGSAEVDLKLLHGSRKCGFGFPEQGVRLR